MLFIRVIDLVALRPVNRSPQLAQPPPARATANEKNREKQINQINEQNLLESADLHGVMSRSQIMRKINPSEAETKIESKKGEKIVISKQFKIHCIIC